MGRAKALIPFEKPKRIKKQLGQNYFFDSYCLTTQGQISEGQTATYEIRGLLEQCAGAVEHAQDGPFATLL